LSRALLLAALSLGCVTRIPPHTVHVPPLVDDVRPPESVIFLQAQVPIDGLREVLDKAIPATRSDEIPLSSGVKLKTQLVRKPLEVRADARGLVLVLGADVTLSSEGGAMACKSRNASVTLEVATRPDIAPDGWLILASPQIDTRVTGSLHCGILPIPLSPILTPIGAALGRGVEEGLRLVRLPMGPLIDKALDALAERRTIELGKESGCLDLDPRALVLSPLGGSGDTLSLKLGVDVAPRLSTGKCPEGRRERPRRAVVARQMPLGDSFSVAVEVVVPYDQLAERAGPSLRGKTFGEGKQQVTVRDATFGDSQGRMLARVTVDGAITGALFLWGTPAIAARDGRYLLSVPDLQVAVETRDVLTRMKLWLWEKHDGGLAHWLKPKLSVDITERLESARTALTGRRELLPQVALVTRFTDVRPAQVMSRQGAAIARVMLVGSAELELSK
jgi:hypothetical protein